MVDEWRDDPTQLKAKVAAFSKLDFPALRDDPDAYARWSFLVMAELDAWQEQNLLLLEPASDDVGVSQVTVCYRQRLRSILYVKLLRCLGEHMLQRVQYSARTPATDRMGLFVYFVCCAC